MGSKYIFKPDSNPGAGDYDPDQANNQTLSKSRAAHINGETSPYRRPKENLPGPGHHDGHLDRFGSKVHHKMDFGNKYVFKPDRNPPPGAYDPESGHNMSKAKSRAAHINRETSPYRRPDENLPGAGHYDGHLSAFGADVTRKIDMGSKYEFKPD